MLTEATPASTEVQSKRGYGDRRDALVLLAVTSAIGGAGLAAGGTATVLVGAQLAGTDAAAGMPLGLLVLGSAGSALVISRQTSRVGPGRSLAAGYLEGAVGAVVVVWATTAESLAGLLVGSVLLGGANASIFLSRYAAAELGGSEARGRALGLVFFSTSIGAVGSPLLLAPSGALANAAGLPRLSGIFVIAALTFGLAAATLAWASRKGRAHAGVAALFRAAGADVPTGRQLLAGVLAAPARLGLAMLAAANLVMVAFMAVAPIHLMGHGQGLEMIGTVISFHVAAMFAPSPVSGWLGDRAGPVVVGAIGFLLILLAGLAGAFVDQGRVPSIVVVLVTLGIGWNFAVVGGSVLIARSVPPPLRVHVEGIGEAAMGVAAAIAAPAAGLVIAFGGFTTLSCVGAGIAAGVLVGSFAHPRDGVGRTRVAEVQDEENEMDDPRVVTYEEWLVARVELLAKEKELTRHRDAVNADRRRLPMVEIDKAYVFEGEDGEASLLDLFDGRGQLLIYHFMWLWDEDQGCPSCSFLVDNIGDLAHAHARDTSLVVITRAPFAKSEPFRHRMGWTVPWYSSFGSDFNYDFHVTLDEDVAPPEYNYRDLAALGTDWKGWSGEQPGTSAFLRHGDRVFHTYSSYARGGDLLLGTYNWLDLTARGRQEDWEMPAGRNDSPGMGWLRHHDSYEIHASE